MCICVENTVILLSDFLGDSMWLVSSMYLININYKTSFSQVAYVFQETAVPICAYNICSIEWLSAVFAASVILCICFSATH